MGFRSNRQRKAVMAKMRNKAPSLSPFKMVGYSNTGRPIIEDDKGKLHIIMLPSGILGVRKDAKITKDTPVLPFDKKCPVFKTPTEGLGKCGLPDVPKKKQKLWSTF